MIFFSTLSNFLLLFSKNGISKCRCKSPAKQSDFIAWWTSCIDNDKLDFIDFEPKDIKTKEELLSYFDQHPFVDGEARTANSNYWQLGGSILSPRAINKVPSGNLICGG